MQITIKFMEWTKKPDFTGDTADLRSADLQGADLQGANLQGANLQGADLQGANLQGANLYGAGLRSADLRSADLYGANLYGANLYGADLQGADLRSANLYGADLYGANLYGADLYGANLRSADLQGANLQGAENAELPIARTSIVPEHGAFTGWKKCKNNVLVKVQIPANAARSNANGRKCRASHVKVLKIEGGHKEAISQHDGKTRYIVGKIVKCDKWCEDRWQECAGGIHFFLTRIEAENY